MDFVCHQCEGVVLEEVMFGVKVFTEVWNISKLYGVEYGEQTNEDGYVYGYMCMVCGTKIAEDEDELLKIAEKRGWI